MLNLYLQNRTLLNYNGKRNQDVSMQNNLATTFFPLMKLMQYFSADFKESRFM